MVVVHAECPTEVHVVVRKTQVLRLYCNRTSKAYMCLLYIHVLSYNNNLDRGSPVSVVSHAVESQLCLKLWKMCGKKLSSLLSVMIECTDLSVHVAR